MSRSDMLIRPQAGAREARIELAEIVSRRSCICYKTVDQENEETMLVFYDPQEDYCVHVSVSQNLHLNEAVRQMKEVLKIENH